MMRACALAIGGLDPGGGAGILADARAIQRTGAFAAAAVSVWTVQSTAGLERVAPVAPREVLDACACVLAHQRVRAIKTGALGDARMVRRIAEWLGEHPRVPVIVDPVVRATRTASADPRTALLDARAVKVLRDELLPRATLVTPNADEARALTGIVVVDAASAEAAARALLSYGARAVLLKGGHVPGDRVCDILVHARGMRTWSRARVALPPLHGGGCTLAALIAGYLAQRAGQRVDARVLEDAVSRARVVHGRALRRAVSVGGPMRVLVP